MSRERLDTPADVWQAQEAEQHVASADEVRSLHSAERVRRFVSEVALLAISVSASLAFGVQALGAGSLAHGVAYGLAALGVLVWAADIVIALRRAPMEMVPDAPLRTGIELYRQTLRETLQRTVGSNRRFRAGLALLIVAAAIGALAPETDAVRLAWLPRPVIEWLPVGAVSWVLFVLLSRLSSIRWLRHEIAALDGLENDG